ncbi:acyltransferase [Sphingomonas sp. ZT3P38]|uniref:acyltransferase family protein n=1 Tax=Parasphingomonas zepuensis TaxID=3096161 RepID=UPI002FCA3056
MRKDLTNIQQLRGIAASLVMLAHVVQSAQKRAYADDTFLINGTIGVDIFFVISGFIMVGVTHQAFGRENSSITFLVRRLIRIVPIYWLYTFLFALMFAVGGAMTSVHDLVFSLTFIPYDASGKLRPILGAGWTLNYEMLFYLVFSISLLFPRKIGISMLFLILGLLVSLGMTYPTGVFYWWSRPIILEFLVGVVVGIAYHGARSPVEFPRPLLSILLLTIGWVVVARISGYSDALSWRPAEWLLAGAIVTIAVFSRQTQGKTYIESALVKLGDWSYSLYLLHIIILLAAAKISDTIFGKVLPLWIAIPYAISIIVVSTACAFLSYRYIERPSEQFLRRIWEGGFRRAPAAK